MKQFLFSLYIYIYNREGGDNGGGGGSGGNHDIWQKTIKCSPLFPFDIDICQLSCF